MQTRKNFEIGHFSRSVKLFSYGKVSEVVARRCSVKKVFLKMLQNSQENTYARACFLNKVASFRPAQNFIKKASLAHIISREFYEIFKNNFFRENLRWLILKFTDDNILDTLTIFHCVFLSKINDTTDAFNVYNSEAAIRRCS